MSSILESDLSEFRKVIAGAMKSLGLTQNALASQLKVSLPTLKRWLRGEGLSLTDLLQLLRAVDLSMSDVAATFDNGSVSKFSYTLEQEEFLAENVGHLAYFDRLLEGRTPLAIKRTCNLSTRSHTRYLRDLEQIGLIERLPREKIRLLVHGEPVWRRGGPLARTLRQSALQEIIDKKNAQLNIALHRYRAEDALRITRLIEDLVEVARSADRRARLADSSDSAAYGLLVGSVPFTPRFMTHIPEL